MSESTQTWAELSDRLDALGLKLKMHLQQAHDDRLADTLARLRQNVEDAFEAASNAVHDDAVRTDVREAGRLLVDAVSATLEKVSGELREAFAKRT